MTQVVDDHGDGPNLLVLDWLVQLEVAVQVSAIF